MDKNTIFIRELKYIKDDKIRTFTSEIISELPDYFFEIPASSTGKYHPSYALGDGGLVRHTIAAVNIANELFRCETVTGHYTQHQKDIIISSLILHDGLKSGLTKQKYSVVEHPLLVSDFILAQHDDLKLIDDKTVDLIVGNIKSHMGQWTFDYKKKRNVLPRPTKGMASFVHMCDYLASRKFIEINFDEIK